MPTNRYAPPEWGADDFVVLYPDPEVPGWWCATCPRITGAYGGASPAEAIGWLMLAVLPGLSEGVVTAIPVGEPDPLLAHAEAWVEPLDVPREIQDLRRGIV